VCGDARCGAARFGVEFEKKRATGASMANSAKVD
jgi:hypothetical protein